MSVSKKYRLAEARCFPSWIMCWNFRALNPEKNDLEVPENERRMALSTNVLFGVQSVYMKEDGLTGMYYRTIRRALPIRS